LKIIVVKPVDEDSSVKLEVHACFEVVETTTSVTPSGSTVETTTRTTFTTAGTTVTEVTTTSSPTSQGSEGPTTSEGQTTTTGISFNVSIFVAIMD
jgi:hypothetical protein